MGWVALGEVRLTCFLNPSQLPAVGPTLITTLSIADFHDYQDYHNHDNRDNHDYHEDLLIPRSTRISFCLRNSLSPNIVGGAPSPLYIASLNYICHLCH